MTCQRLVSQKVTGKDLCPLLRISRAILLNIIRYYLLFQLATYRVLCPNKVLGVEVENCSSLNQKLPNSYISQHVRETGGISTLDIDDRKLTCYNNSLLGDFEKPHDKFTKCYTNLVKARISTAMCSDPGRAYSLSLRMSF